ncbi:MAG: uroporphyrinogen decarboxylase family protein [Kiritimatiellae bacterium]|nr:uroporphyrinogen decarboxylase family protein [Kiritimatiellia bacterium]
MTKRERFLAFATFQPVDRVPRRADYVESLTQRMTEFLGRDPRACFDTDMGRGTGLQPPEGFQLPDYSVYHPGRVNGRDGFSIDSNGCGHQLHGFYHFTEYISPLRDATKFAELESYPIASNATWLDDQMRETVAQAHAAGDTAWVFLSHMYESAWQVRGYEPFLMDLLTQRDWAELLLDRFCENNLRSAIAVARAGYDCLGVSDDVANQNDLMFSPEVWRTVMKPRWAKVIAAARAIKPDLQVWYHSDGNIWAILDDLVEIGITILNPVQPECMDPLAIRRRFGKRLAFDGCVGTQSTFPFGTPADMRRVVHDLGTQLEARRGGLMLSPTHILEPEVPPENVVAFFRACDEL